MTTRVWADISRDTVSMIQYSERPEGRYFQMPGDQLPQLVPTHHMAPPEAIVQLHDPQELLDELLKAGYRPSDNKWSGGHVRALEAHIAFAEKVASTLLEKA